MNSFTDVWPPFDHAPMLTNNCDAGFQYEPQIQPETANIQDAEWTGILESIEQDHETAGTEFELLDFNSRSQATSGAMATLDSMPLVSSLSAYGSNSATMSPAESATRPGISWTAASAPTMAHSPGVMHTNIANSWLSPHTYHQGQRFDPGHGLGIGMTDQIPTGDHHFMQVDDIFKPGSPSYEQIMSIKHDPGDIWNHSEDHLTLAGDNGHGDDDDVESADPCYAQLLYRCLKDVLDHTLSLKEIYEWVAQYSHKAKDPKQRGWQNSVRHNLSMNAVSTWCSQTLLVKYPANSVEAFERVPANPSQGAKKGSLWRLTQKALTEGVISTTRYRKDPKRKPEHRGHPAPKRQLSGAKGGQATRAATRRNREMHHMRSTPYPSTFDRPRHHQSRHNSGFVRPHSMQPAIPTPQSTSNFHSQASPLFLPSCSLFIPGLDSGSPHLASSPLEMRIESPPQVPLSYVPSSKSMRAPVSPFDLQHIDYSHGPMIGDNDPETPSLATETDYMTDDGLLNTLS